MIELPEAVTIARQIDQECTGRQIDYCQRGNVPHKFAFYNHTPEEYAEILKGKHLEGAYGLGGCIYVTVEDDDMIVLGVGGERILYHKDEKTLPKKHHFMLKFVDDAYLTVSVQGWGAALLLHKSEVGVHPFTKVNVSPLSDEFSEAYFLSLFDTLRADDPKFIKFFMISEPGIWGLGNGCLQDILFHAKIHPRRRAVNITLEERKALYRATRQTLMKMVEGGGRDTEYDLYNRPGGYPKILDSRSVGKPCPVCSTPFEKASFLGGTVYFCPSCQT